MHIQLTGHNCDITEALKEYTEKKTNRLCEQFHQLGMTSLHVIYEVNKKRHIIKVHCALPKESVNAEAESESMYESVDLMIERLKRKFVEHKEKMSDHRS